MEQTYAQALWKTIEKGMPTKKAVALLRDVLKRSGREALLPRIGKALARIAAREGRKTAVVLSVAREKDATGAKRVAKAFLDELGASAEDVETRVDESLIGGWRLEGRGRLVDASFKKSLLAVYNRATH